MSHTANPIQSEIIRQVKASVPARVWKSFRLVSDTPRPNWLRFSSSLLKRNVDIEYIEGVDLYTVEIHDLLDMFNPKTRKFERVYNEDLGQLIATPREGRTNQLFIPEVLVTGAMVTNF